MFALSKENKMKLNMALTLMMATNLTHATNSNRDQLAHHSVLYGLGLSCSLFI
jgi:hypothetical protein